MVTSLLNQSFLKGRNECLVAGSKGTGAYNMNIIVNGLPCYLFRCLEKTSNINVETKISKSTGNNLGTTVMTILSHFGNQNSRVASLGFAEVLNNFQGLFVFNSPLVSRFLGGLLRVGTSDNTVLSNMSTIDLF